MYIQFPGDLFLRMLKAMVIPLMVSSVTSAVGSLDLSLSKKIGGRALVYYFSTTILAVIEGLILVLLIHPGRADISSKIPAFASRPVTTTDTLLDLVRYSNFLFLNSFAWEKVFEILKKKSTSVYSTFTPITYCFGNLIFFLIFVTDNSCFSLLTIFKPSLNFFPLPLLII